MRRCAGGTPLPSLSREPPPSLLRPAGDVCFRVDLRTASVISGCYTVTYYQM